MSSRTYIASGLFALGALAAACNDDAADTAQAGEAFTLSTSALENPIRACQAEAFTCLRQASGATELQACQRAAGECLTNAAGQVRRAAAALDACRDEQRSCLREGGRSGAAMCNEAARACVDSIGAGSGDAGVASDAGSDATVDTVSDASAEDAGAVDADASQETDAAPSEPSRRDGGTASGRPGRGDGTQSPDGGDALPGGTCLEQLRECASQDNVRLSECAERNQRCLFEAVRSARR